ncbi:MAG: hypothetical protein QOE65_84 [Solirubrobacteraceae bacterium]|jgi:O-antigen/teichoic acid export membrane protein|nr:hypothetical protein [Solirubrobacteraceae bacterium]
MAGPPPDLPQDAIDEAAAATRAEASAQDVLDSPSAGAAAIRGGVLRIVAYFAGVVLSIGSAALLFRHLGVDGAGRYVTVLSLVAVVGGLTEAGLTALGVRELSQRAGAERGAVMRTLLGVRLMLTSAGVLLAGLFAGLAGYGEVLVIGTLVAGVGLVFQNLQSTLAISLMTRLRFGWVAIADLLRQVVTVALIVALVELGASILPFLAVPVAASLVVLALSVRLVRGDVPAIPSFDSREMWRLTREALPFGVATAVNAIYFRVAIIIVSLVATAQQTGYFGASFRVIEVLIVIPSLAVGAVFPIFARAARDDHTRLAYALERSLEACLIFGSVVALGVSVGAPFIIDVVAGPKFGPAVDVLRIQGLALLGSFATVPWGFVLVSLGRYRELLVINGVALALSAGLTAFLTSADGARGAAFATTVGEFFLAASAAFVLYRSYPALRPSLRVVPAIVAAGALAVAVAVFVPLPAVVLAPLSGIVFLTVVAAAGAIPDELFAEVRKLRHSRTAA